MVGCVAFAMHSFVLSIDVAADFVVGISGVERL